jgi:hypothetical protein
MTVSSLVFPSFLSNANYENKKVTFKAMLPSSEKTESADAEDSSIFDKVKVAYNDVVNKTKELAQSVAGAIPDGFDLESSVTLPYPVSLSDNQNHSWENTEGLLAQTSGTALNVAGEIAGNLKEKISNNIVKSALGDSDPDKLYAAISNNLGIRKNIIDPGYFQNYTGSAPRSFVMAYTLVPQSQHDAQMIKDIILWFKQYSSPTFISGSPLMGAPFLFNISFAGNAYLSDMFKMDKCVLTGISVDYASDGAFMLYKDGFPKQIGLALNFAEVELKYAQDYAGLSKDTTTDRRNSLNDIKSKL